ncbi:hypothetical protein [Pedobacter immunditicola]|uniref:hypothetical protein n=1 Tax=Pedobacter immunditicola TaxID=3133440 RepID=UPI0030AF1310
MTLTKKCVLLFSCIIIISCKGAPLEKVSNTVSNPMIGTWKLLMTTTVENGDSTVTDYNKNVSFIKIINQTHFAFLQHDLNKGKDTTALFVAGGGRYQLTGTTYKEQLEYCSARDWEGHDFTFNIELKNDTLVQSGEEKVEAAGVNRVTIEKYVRQLE